MHRRVLKNNQIDVGSPLKIIISETKQQHENKDIEDKNKTIIEQAKIESEKILSQAHKKAKKIVKDAEQEAAAIKNNIKDIADKGYKNGFDKGYEDVRKERESLIKEVETLRCKTQQEYKKRMESVENDAINLVMEISKKIIYKNYKDEIIEIVKKSIEKCCNVEKISIKVSSKDYSYIYYNRDKIISAINGLEKLELIQEDSLEEGGCIIETSYGSVDVSISSRLERIEKAFYQILDNKTI